MRKIIVFIITRIIYLWGRLFYDKKYLCGELFNKYHYSQGWTYIRKCWFPQKILGYARNVGFPVSRTVTVIGYKNIEFDPDNLTNFFSPGCYYQALDAKIIIGKDTFIGPNCGIITTNHDIRNLKNHVPGKDVIIGNNCWIGMNSVILPGVKLGNNTIVGVGSIVTKSFEEGNVVIAGNPAKIIKRIDNNES